MRLGENLGRLFLTGRKRSAEAAQPNAPLRKAELFFSSSRPFTSDRFENEIRRLNSGTEASNFSLQERHAKYAAVWIDCRGSIEGESELGGARRGW